VESKSGGGSKDSADGRRLFIFVTGSNGSNRAFRRSESSEIAVESSCSFSSVRGSSCLLGGSLALSSVTLSKFLPLAVGNKLLF
jgi:hypothetical protein